MRPSMCLQLLQSCFRPDLPPLMLWGPPGCGKSAVVQQAARAADRKVFDVRCVLRDSVDFGGLPVPDLKKGTARFVPFTDLLPQESDGPAVLFLDELPQARPEVQAAILGLIYDRRSGGYTLPEDCVIVAAGNRQEDRAGANRLITPVLNRLVHIEFEPDLDDFCAWYHAQELDATVPAFLRWKPTLLLEFKPERGERAWPTPRSWTFAGQLLGRVPEELLSDTLAGAVGQGAAAEFLAFKRLVSALPDVDTLIANPARFKCPTEPSLVWALAGAIASRAKHPATWPGITKILNQFPLEYGVCLARDAQAASGRQFLSTDQNQGIQPWLITMKDVLS